MVTKSKNLIALVADLNKLIAERKKAESREKEIKEYLRSEMGDELVLEAGEYCVVRKCKTRRDLDKTAIQHDLGPEFFKKYEKLTEYETMEITAVASSGVA